MTRLNNEFSWFGNLLSFWHLHQAYKSIFQFVGCLCDLQSKEHGHLSISGSSLDSFTRRAFRVSLTSCEEVVLH